MQTTSRALTRPRRAILARTATAFGALLAGVAAAGCNSGSASGTETKPASTAAATDPKSLAVALQGKTTALIDAINAKNADAITKAKTDLNKEADHAEDALQSQTGQQANLVNSAVSNIRTAMINNDVNRLTRAREQLQQAQQ